MRVESGPKEVAPVPPVTVALLVVRSHHAIGDVVVRKVAKSFPLVVLGRVSKSQHAPCGRGKEWLKWVRNWWLDGNFSNEREALSAMRLREPGMW